MDKNIINEHSLISFANDILSMDPVDCDIRAVELINYVEESNLDISNYKYLHFYATFNNLLNNNLLKEEFKNKNVDNNELTVLTENSLILNEASSEKRVKVTKLIVDSLNLVDRTKLNSNKYEKFLNNMNDVEFKKYMDDFTNDPEKNFYLELLPNKNEPSIYDIEKLLTKLKIPKEEYVYYKDNGFKDDPIRSREKCSVGYVNVRRLQQILSKKNTYSLDIDNRNTKTGQVSGDAKIARISDAELYGLTVFQADAAIKEFYSARADNMVAKNDMYSKISKYGYVYLDELNTDITKNQTLNTINTYLLGAGIKSDLVEDDTTKAADTLRKQVIDNELLKMKGSIVKEEVNILNEESKLLNYYIVYPSNSDNKKLSPRVPINYLTKNGYEDNKTPRVCASSSIEGCLKALSRNLKDEKLFVHKVISDRTPINPSISQVPDCKITDEVWFKNNIVLKCIGEILITGDDNKPGYKYTYGDNKSAELYGWDYKWINKFNEDTVLNENTIDKLLVFLDKPKSKLMNDDIEVYHGSPINIKDNKLKPLGVNVGATKFSNPRWSVFIWDNYESAAIWALSQTINREVADVIFNPQGGKIQIINDTELTNNEFKNTVLSYKLSSYVYSSTIPINKLEMGSSGGINEYTVSEEIDISNKKIININKKNLDKYFTIVKYDKNSTIEDKIGKMPRHGSSRSWILNKILDNSRDIQRMVIRNDIRNGKLSTGDDLSSYKKIINQGVSDNSFNLPLEDTRITTSREYAFIAIDDIEAKKGYVDYEATDRQNGKYVNLTLEGLEKFLESNNLTEYTKYIKVPREQVEIMLYDEPSEGAIIKLPFACDIEEYKNLNKKGDN